MDDKMVLYRESCFPNCKKIMVNKVTFLGFRGGGIAPNRSPLVPLNIKFSNFEVMQISPQGNFWIISLISSVRFVLQTNSSDFVQAAKI